MPTRRSSASDPSSASQSATAKAAKKGTPRKASIGGEPSRPAVGGAGGQMEYGPVVSRRPGASSLLIESSIGPSEVAAVTALEGQKTKAVSPEGGAPSTPTSPDTAMEVVDTEGTGDSGEKFSAAAPTAAVDATVEEVESGVEQLSIVEEEPERAAPPAVPKKWQPLESPDADFRRNSRAGMDEAARRPRRTSRGGRQGRRQEGREEGQEEGRRRAIWAWWGEEGGGGAGEIRAQDGIGVLWDDRRSVRHAKRHDGLGLGAVQCPRMDDGAAER